MRLGVFSDTHANYEALSAVLESYRRERIDIYYCLGDTVGYGGSPNECADLVRKISRATILGNHDAAVSGRMDYSYYYEAARHALDVHAAMISEENMEWLKSLPYQHLLEAYNVLLCHGSPVRLEEFDYIFAPEQARECLSIYDKLGHITLIGHSHVALSFHREDGESATGEARRPEDAVAELGGRRWLLNPGSVGQPRDGDPRAAWLLLDLDEGSAQWRRTAYDVDGAAAAIRAARLPDSLAERLEYGQ